MFIVDCIIELVLNIFIGKEKRCKDLLGKTFIFVNGTQFAENGLMIQNM